MNKISYRALKAEFSPTILTGFVYTCVWQMNDIIGESVTAADVARYLGSSKPVAKKILDKFVENKIMRKYRNGNCDKYYIDRDSVYLSESIHLFHMHSYDLVASFKLAQYQGA